MEMEGLHCPHMTCEGRWEINIMIHKGDKWDQKHGSNLGQHFSTERPLPFFQYKNYQKAFQAKLSKRLQNGNQEPTKEGKKETKKGWFVGENHF